MNHGPSHMAHQKNFIMWGNQPGRCMGTAHSQQLQRELPVILLSLDTSGLSHAMSGFGLKSYNHYGLGGWACGDEVAGKAESSRRGVSKAGGKP